VKVLRRDGEDAAGTLRDDFVQRFLREARAAASLKHPNVVAIHDVGVDEEPYIVMEWVEGASLRGFIGDASIPIARRIEWLVEIARALAAAHELGLVHRDIKPDNVMITKDGHAKVLDFGIAKLIGTEDAPSSQQDAPESFRTQQGRIVGTPKYMAPEQLRGDAIDARVDQWAWACVAYELLAGSMPDRDEVAQPISLTMPEVPFDVAAAIVRARSLDPAKRFDSMRALLAALAVQPSGEVTVSVPPKRDPDAPTTTGPVRRSWLRVVLVAVASFGVASAAVFAWQARHRTTTIAPTPVAPPCSFTMLADTPLGAMPQHFITSAEPISGGLVLVVMRATEAGNQEDLVTITPDAVTTRTPPPPPVVTGSATTAFVLSTPSEARHYLVFNGESGAIVVGRNLANDGLNDMLRLVGDEPFRPFDVAGFYATSQKPAALAILAFGNDAGVHSTIRPTLRLFGRSLRGREIFRSESTDSVRGLAVATSEGHVAYTYSSNSSLFLGSFAIEGRIEDQPGPVFGSSVRVETTDIVDVHAPVVIGDASAHPARAFDGEMLHVVWPERGHARFRHATLRTDALDLPVVDEPFDVPTDGSPPDLRITGSVFELAWHDGAHVRYGAGPSVRAAASSAISLPDASVFGGPWIVPGQPKMVTWVSGTTETVRRAIVSCR
jgi:hypothetical protein